MTRRARLYLAVFLAAFATLWFLIGFAVGHPWQ